MELNHEEQLLIEEFRRKRVESEAARAAAAAQQAQPFDISAIKPGMTPEQANAASQAILAALRDQG
jgi:hypothetical protein